MAHPCWIWWAYEMTRATDTDDLGFAQVDVGRAVRQGVAEVIYGEGKSPAQIAAIAQALLSRDQNVLITRASTEAFTAVSALAPQATFHERARVIRVERTAPVVLGSCAVAAAGTSDLPVVEECASCLSALGITPELVLDIGVAGIQRTLGARERLEQADVVIVVAGMEGALASVIGGLVSKPVIAVPTSVGYGSAFEGLAALLSMLNACASGIVVVNIDNGFGAAMAARRILQARGRGS
jgi:pyridinium-3,5-biscarboxylic acid mononucleotide synthase